MPIDDRAAVERHKTVAGVPNHGDAQRVAFRVGVVRQQLLRREGHGVVLFYGERIVDADGRIVDRADGNGDQSRRGVGAVGDGVGEAACCRLGAIVPIDDRVAVERDETVGRVSDRGDAQPVALRVGVVGQQLLRRGGHRVALLDGERIVDADGRIVDRVGRRS